MRIQFLALALIPVAYGQVSGKCADLAKFKIPGVSISVAITKTETVPAAALLPSFCRAEGMIDSRTGAGGKAYGIGFAIALPDNWNNRFLFQGGGGFNGTVRPPLGAAAAGDSSALARGFAVVSTDTGHQGGDRSFFQDQQAGLDFAYVAIGKVAVAGKQILTQYYGQPARYSYFVGCSTGGREAMTMTQRYPEYFDGVVSGDPAMRTSYAQIGRAWTTVAFNQIAPRDDAGPRQRRVARRDVNPDEVPPLLQRRHGRRPAPNEAVEHEVAGIREQPNDAARERLGELRFVVVVGAHRRDPPNAARAPLGPLAA